MRARVHRPSLEWRCALKVGAPPSSPEEQEIDDGEDDDNTADAEGQHVTDVVTGYGRARFGFNDLLVASFGMSTPQLGRRQR
jgi:hypothetical protein